MTSRSTDLLEGALGLAARGIPVIPLRPRSKVPLHPRWPKLGLLDPDSIRLEWKLTPDANVGVLCGPDAFDGRGLTVLDVDWPDGPLTLEALQEGPFPGWGPSVCTPGLGAHHYMIGTTASWNPGPGLEVRSVARQCAAPPSIHPNGGRYEWGVALDVEVLQPLPEWLRRRDHAHPRGTRAPAAAFTPSGLRDPVLEVSPRAYFRELCGLEPDPDGFVCCPIHGENVASLKVYDTADRGWFCYGESCRRGGDVVTLVAELAGVSTPVRGYQFVALLEYLRGRLM
jgi:hypothetical protein